MKEKLVDILVQYRLRALLFAGLIILVMGVFIRPPEISGELTGFSAADTKFVKSGQKIAAIFGSKRFIQIKINPDLKAPVSELFSGIEALEKQLKIQYPHAVVQSVNDSKSLLNISSDSAEPVSDFIERASELPMLNQLVGESKNSVLCLVWMDTLDTFYMPAYEKIVNQKYSGIQSMQSMSPFHLESAIAKSIGRDLVVLSAVIALFFLVFVWYAYRSFSAVVFIGLIVGVCLTPALLLFSILHLPFNLITVLVVPVILVLALSDAIHLLTGWSHQQGSQSYEQKLRAVLSDYMVPSFYTSFTTSIALCSFLFNESENIRNFGLISGIAVMVAYLLTFLVAPFVLKYVRLQSIAYHGISRFVDHFLRKKKVYTVVLTAGVILFFATMNQLRFNTDMDDFIPRRTQLHDDYSSILEEYSSQLRLEVMLSTDTSVTDKITLSLLKEEVYALHSMLEKVPLVGSVSSIRDWDEFKSKFGPASAFIRFPSRNNPFVNNSKTAYRLDVRVRQANDLVAVNNEIHRYIRARNLPFETTTFSRGLLMNEVNTQVAKSLLWSMFSSVLIIAFLFLFMTRSVRYALFALYANLVPLAFMMLIFWIFRLDLNVLTAITAVVCIGLVVDDTIHVLYRQINLMRDLRELGFGVLTTSILLFGGFASFALSSFVPSQVFGLVAAFTFMMAVIADLTVLPYLLERWPVKGLSKKLPETGIAHQKKDE